MRKAGVRCPVSGVREISHFRAPGTEHRTPRNLVSAVVTLIAVAGCEVTAPNRSDFYAFQLQPENLVFSWPADRLPVTYFAQSIGALPDYVNRALGLWESQFLYGEFEGALTSDSAAADVRVTIEGGAPPPAALNSDAPVIACDGSTSAFLGTGNQLAGPILIHVRWFAGFQPADIANCLARVTAHEIGHSLGLFQHSTRTTDLMFGVPGAREPSVRDRSSVEVLYHTQSTLKPADRP